MPKRSNAFQRLVKLINERLINNDWEVTESEMLLHNVTREETEVDIVLRHKLKIGNYPPILISIECRDQKRPADRIWVEQIIKKHESLPTSQLILWSSSGFYKPAILVAEQEHVKAITPTYDEDKDWALLSKNIKSGFLKVVTPRFTHFIDVVDLKGEKIRLETPRNYLFRVKATENFFALNHIKENVVTSEELRSTILDHATQEKTDFWVEFIPPFECQVQNDNDDWVEVFRIGFGIKADVEETSINEVKKAYFENRLSTLAIAKLKNASFEIFIQEKAGENPEVKANIVKKL